MMDDPSCTVDLIDISTDSPHKQYPCSSRLLPKIILHKAMENDFRALSGRLLSTSTPFSSRTIGPVATCLTPNIAESSQGDSAIDMSHSEHSQESLLTGSRSYVCQTTGVPLMPKFTLFQDNHKTHGAEQELHRMEGKPLVLSFPAFSDQFLSAPRDVPCFNCSRDKSHSDSSLSSSDSICKYNASHFPVDCCLNRTKKQASMPKGNSIVRPKTSSNCESSTSLLSNTSEYVLSHSSHDTGYSSELSVELSSVDPAMVTTSWINQSDNLVEKSTVSPDSGQFVDQCKPSSDLFKTSTPLDQSTNPPLLQFPEPYIPEMYNKSISQQSCIISPLMLSPRLLESKAFESLSPPFNNDGMSSVNNGSGFEFSQLLEKFAPIQLDRLIGRKMGCVCVDIFAELHGRGIVQPLSLIMKHLSRRDLHRMCKVSEQWKLIVEGDMFAAKHLAERKQRRLIRSLQKENCYRKTSAPVSHPVTTSHGPLVEVQPTVPTVQSQANHAGVNQQVQHALQLSQKYWKEAELLKNEETLRKCPKCNSPAKTEPLQERAWCTKGECRFDFCIKCRGAFHGSKDCAVATTPQKQRPELKVCGKKSKKNLRRL